ncbi:MAG: hypothetical protein L6Q99_11880 [Planctomycetes bacterium]|nr:hypothetical protein [Planctomycetota bacterium]
MTALLVFSMVCVALAAHLYLTRHRRRIADRARAAVRFVAEAPIGSPSPTQRFHRGHTWVERHDSKLASIGVSSLAANFIGELDALELPPEGSKVEADQRIVTLVAKNGRRLSLPLPVGGKVLAVNAELGKDPTLLQRRPYDQGWLVRIAPKEESAELAPLAVAQRWFDDARAALSAKLSPVPATVAFDGGDWVQAFGERFDDEEWRELRRELFGARESAPVHPQVRLQGHQGRS